MFKEKKWEKTEDCKIKGIVSTIPEMKKKDCGEIEQVCQNYIRYSINRTRVFVAIEAI